MIKKYGYLVLIMILITGCSLFDNGPSLGELADINDQIISYFQVNNPEYNNFSYNYVDETEKKIVVGLINNTKEEQERFKNMVINSEYIIFKQAEEKSE